jgi:hypothetical protein
MFDHIGIGASDLAASKAFYLESLAPDYYAAFVIGPDGHNIEVVCHKPAAAA